MATLRLELGVPADDEWAPLPANSAGGRRVTERRNALRRQPTPAPRAIELPADLERAYRGVNSTQKAFGEILMAIARTAPAAAERIVTVSPDVATSTNLGGWINRVGLWEPLESADLFSELGPRLINWRRGRDGQHLELGISETNLLMLLGQLGTAAEMTGEALLPIGTLYDPFIARGLEALMYGVYQGGRFIVAGTPSGVTLAPEGGAHQSVITPVVGLATPLITYWEPCFAQDLEWILLESLAALHRTDSPEASYLRLTTAPVDQSLLPAAEDREARRRAVLSGVYRLVDRSSNPGARADNQVRIWATGIMVPEALRASDELLADGVYASVFNCVSPDRVYRAWQSRVLAGLDRALRPAEDLGAPAVELRSAPCGAGERPKTSAG
ncbi:MAG: hypothetical protein M3256_03680 [Actinomycetota bacterium]|nr:hypothetical protein [Actinomycetota bacterium]